MITVSRFQGFVICQNLKDWHEIVIQCCPMLPSSLSLVVALECR